MRFKYGLLFALLLTGLTVLASSIAAPSAKSEESAGEGATADAAIPPSAVELPDTRTANSTTYRLANGSFQTKFFSTAVNYETDDGNWKPINEDLEAAPSGGLTNGANDFDLHLPSELGAGAVRLADEGNWFSFRLLGEHSEPAEVDGSIANYESGNGASFELRSLPDGVKEEITLDNPLAPSVFRFALDLSGNLEPSLEDDGSIRIIDADGRPFATLPAPTISDADDIAPVEAVVHYTLQRGSEDGHWTVVVEADETWLSDPDRAWPVKIDPSAIFVTDQDCTIGSNPLPKGWRVCGSTGATELIAGYNQVEKQPIRTFLRFDVGTEIHPTLPEDAYIGKAVLKLYAAKAAENTVPGLETRRVTRDWGSAINWEKATSTENWATPGGDFNSEGKSEILTSKRGSGPGWWEFTSQSLRELMQGWNEYTRVKGNENGIRNQGLVVKQIDETRTAECESGGQCPRRHVGFNSSAALSNRPELHVNYFRNAPSTNKMISPEEGTTTARRLLLRAAWAPGVTGIQFQYRAGKQGSFNNIPSLLLRNGKGEQVDELAVSESCCQSEPVYFDAAHINSEIQGKGGTVQVRALFQGGTGAGYSQPVEAEVDRYIGGPKDEVTQVGPGTLDLMTGNLSLSDSDVSIGGFNALSFSRSYNTRVPGTVGDTTVLGQGWKSGAELAGGSEWANLKLTSRSEEIEGQTYAFAYATITSIDGKDISFEKVGEAFLAPPELSGYALTTSGGNYVLADPNGNKTTFSNAATGSASEYAPVSFTQLGSGPHSTAMTWAFVNGQRRLVREVAPSATLSTATCAANLSTTGCHRLEFTYAPASTWGAPASYGDRLQKITFHAPGEGGPWDVAAYKYDNTGRLIQEWDPRLTSEPEASKLKTVYTYEGSKLRKVTPPGQEPWTLEYAPQMDGEVGAVSRLKALKRTNLLGGETKTSIRYEVPLSGSSAPYQMGGTSVGAWGQTDIPTDATAIFPPTEVPAEPASSYEKATIYYMDSEGFGVNTATPAGAGMSGPSITTTEADEFGNVTRELSAQNRLRALVDPEGKTVERSHLLESKFTYSSNGTELLAERGPLHRVKLQEGGGEIAEARLQRTIAYGNPENLNPPPLLPTKEVTGAIFPNKGIEADQRVTETRYNWSLRAPTERIVDAGLGHLNIKRKTAYNGIMGLPTETRQPQASEESGDVPGATKTIYYGEPSSRAECLRNDEWAGLPCRIEPAAQPAGGPAMPVTIIKAYSPLGQPTEIVEETPGAGAAGIRKTTITYDSAGRQTSKKIAGGGQVVPKVETLYSSINGMPSTQRFACELSECSGFDAQATTIAYDALGRMTSYEDADGSKSERTYDSFGRPSTATDGKGSQTITYDAVSGLPTALTDSAAGTFTASYDADGNMVKRGLPNGLTAETAYDPTGASVALTYTKASNCGASCTWLQFSRDASIYGQVLAEQSTLGNQRFDYDRVGRLVEAQETPSGGSCTTRGYAYDKNSNRVLMTTVGSTLGSGCGTGSLSEKKYSYDKADHLIDPGVVHDSFGRITKLPAADAGGKELVTGYFATDMVASQSQGGITNTFELDAALRQRSRLQGGGGLEGTEVFHYAGVSDATAWTQRGSAWTRNIVGIGGELAATQESGFEVTLQLTNLHGDVVATAALNPAVTGLKATSTYDEFGNRTTGLGGRYGWLGGLQRRTELPTGIVQMGARSYVPQLGRFLSTDSVRGGSANAYDYGNADPVNQFDPSGTKPHDNDCDPGLVLGTCQVWLHIKMWSPTRGRMGVRMIYKSNRRGGIRRVDFHINYWVDEKDDVYREGFVEMEPPHYLNSYPGVPSSCRGIERCASNHDGS